MYPAEVGRPMRKVKRYAHLHRKKRDEEDGLESSSTTTTTTTAAANATGPVQVPTTHSAASSEEDEEEEEAPQMNMYVTIVSQARPRQFRFDRFGIWGSRALTPVQIVMVLDTVLVGVTAEFLVDSINGLVASNPSLSAEWVGLILLPIVSGTADAMNRLKPGALISAWLGR